MTTPMDGSDALNVGPTQDARYPIAAENVAEMARLIKQARLMTERFSLFPEQIDLRGKQTILDIGCGPGEWALTVAKKYPWCQVIGIDISQMMIEYARYTAAEQEIPNVDFRMMDASQPLQFQDATFDLLHARFISGFMSPGNWPRLLAECLRRLRPGGVMCSLETDGMGVSTSPSMMRYQALMVKVARMAGRDFISEGDRIGIMAVQARLLQNAGFVNIQQQANVLNYSAGMPTHQTVVEDLGTFMKLIQPFVLQMGLVSREDLEVLYNRAMEEMQREDFCAVSFGQTVWGEKPE